MMNDKLHQDREKAMSNFIDEVFEYSQIHKKIFENELLYLLHFLILKTNEIFVESEVLYNDNGGKNVSTKSN